MNANVILFDVDGTLANLSQRLHWIEKMPKNWKKFFEDVPFDQPITDNIEVCNHFYKLGYDVNLFSGRSETCRDATEKWMDRYEVLYNKLYMRPAHERRPDYQVKFDMLTKHFPDKSKIFAVFDDRDQVVKMWRDNGIRCYQVAFGDF